MSVKEKFVLKWADYSSTVTAALQDLRNHEELFDITLAVENKQILAHKLVLAASSSFFRNVIKNNPHHHPLLYLKGVKYSNLVSVLNFMYHGQVSVVQDELTSFLNVAEELNVRGLTNNQTNEQPPPVQTLDPEIIDQPRRRNDNHHGKGGDSRPVEVDIDDPDDEIKVSKVVNVKKRGRPSEQQAGSNTTTSKKTSVTQTANEQDQQQTINATVDSPRQPKRKRREHPGGSSRSISSGTASTDFQEDEYDTDHSGVAEIRRSKRKAKKRVFLDAVVGSDKEEDEGKIPYRSSKFKDGVMAVIKPEVASSVMGNNITAENSDEDVNKSDIDNLLDNDTNDESDNEKMLDFHDKDDEIEVEESTSTLKREINSSSDKILNADDDSSGNLPVLADSGFHNPAFYNKSETVVDDDSEEEKEDRLDKAEKEILRQLNEALDDLTKDYLVQVPSKDWKCLYCMNLFYAKLTAQHHVEGEHLASPGHVCPTCFKKFQTIKAVKDHVLAGHEVEDGDGNEQEGNEDEDDNEIQCEQDIPLIRL